MSTIPLWIASDMAPSHQKRYRWRSLIGLCRGGIRHQPGERRDSGLGMRRLREPFAESQHVQPHGRQNVSETDPRKADVTGAPQTCGPYPSRDGAFNAGTARIRRLKRVRSLPVAGRFGAPASMAGAGWSASDGGRKHGAPPRICLKPSRCRCIVPVPAGLRHQYQKRR